jgi:two-component system sensor kinase FixL
VLVRVPLQPALGATSPFIFTWPATMLAAFMGGFWPAFVVTLVGLPVGQHALVEGGAKALGPGAQGIYLAFGLVFAVAGGMRQRGIHRARADAERLNQMHEQLTNVARLNAVGEMAATLSHELNQPLTAISNYMGAARRLLARPHAPAEQVQTLMDKAAEQAVRAREIIGRVRAQVRGEMAFGEESLSSLVAETLAVARMNGGADGIQIRVDLDPAADHVRVDRIQIQQVLLNLIRNAAEAMAERPRRELTVASLKRPTDQVEVCVADTGEGIAPEVASRLFEPFATAKATGTGLGLCISRGIVEAHGGRMWADLDYAGGAAFRFTLELAEPSAAAA